MHNTGAQKAEQYAKNHHRRSLWQRIVGGLACVVVFVTTYVLILPAITLEKETCEIPEHIHTEACYTQVTSASYVDPVCTLESLSIHKHDDSCYDDEGKLVCGYADFVVHTHDSSCYDKDSNLWCPLLEVEIHEHTESCYAVSEKVHTHTDDCYIVEQGELICAESKETAHEHTDECYNKTRTLVCDLTTETELICNRAEVILHEHNSDCFDDTGNLICGTIQVLEHQHTDACFETLEKPVDTKVLTCTNKDEDHTHTALCYGEWELTCGMVEHTHSEKCNKDNLQVVLPEGANVPVGYAEHYNFIDSDNRFAVMVFAPKGALPKDVVLSAKQFDTESKEYAAAGQALVNTKHDGFVAMELRFLLNGEEVEPEGSVYVCVNIMGALSETADPESLAVQQLLDSQNAALSGQGYISENMTGTVVDAVEMSGSVQILDDSDAVAAAFEVNSSSMFTVTWQEAYKLILHYVDAEGNEIEPADSKLSLAADFGTEIVSLSQYAGHISHADCVYSSSYVYVDGEKKTVVEVGYDKTANKWIYSDAEGNDYSDWMDGKNHRADVYLVYAPTKGQDIIPTANNVFPIDAFNVWDENANAILLYPKLKSPDEDISVAHVINIGSFFGTDFARDDWTAYRIEMRDGRYQVIQKGIAQYQTGVQVNDSYLLLVKKSYIENYKLYDPFEDWPDPATDASLDGMGDTVSVNLLCDKTAEKSSNGTPLAYLTFSPKNNTATAEKRDDDVAAVEDSAIRFRLFNYSTLINRPNGSSTGWRAITPYFQFRGYSADTANQNLANGDRDNRYDEDGFTVNHATVERLLNNNYPVLDPNRNALGSEKSPEVTEAMLSWADRSLAYLFGGQADGEVTAYNPKNTILQKDGNHYSYSSALNAVDYDIDNDIFRVRNYVERNSSTASYDSAQENFDFLPFNYTGGEVVGTIGGDARTYNLQSEEVDYWFGMRMDVDFYQSKNGILNDEEMIFHFSGDDDVWVFIDDVLVLDLGGTHGSVTGSINFATGEILQYLDWNGTVGTEGETSFPTTLKACYEAAGKKPNGGWNGNIFADYTQHKLSFFYIERGCAVANCSIDFNLPTQPEKSLQVTKTLVAKDNADNEVVQHLQDTMVYMFRVVKADANGKPTDELLVKQGDTFIRTGLGVTDADRNGVVGKDGFFTLKSGQTAEFANMLERFEGLGSKYFVQEFMPDGIKGQYGDVLYNINGDEGRTTDLDASTITDFSGFSSPELDADTANLVLYKNVVNTEELCDLLITKETDGSSVNGQQDLYYIKVTLGPDSSSLSPLSVGMPYTVGSETRYVEQAGIIILASGETAQLKLLAGTYYEIVEVADANGTALTGEEDYRPTYEGQTIGRVDAPASKVEITVVNTYPTGTLTLEKTVVNTDGGSTSGEFSFEISFPVSDPWDPITVPVSYTGSGQQHEGTTLQFTRNDASAVATVKLYHGETVRIEKLPSGASVTIKELFTDGYSVSWWVDGQNSLTKDADVLIGNDNSVSVACTNTTGYELPATGGIGTILWTVGGLLITVSALFMMYIYAKRKSANSTGR